MHVRNLCEFVKMGLLINFYLCILVLYAYNYSNIWRDKNLCGTNLCNLCLTRIIRINKSHAEICRFTVINSSYSLLLDCTKMGGVD